MQCTAKSKRSGEQCKNHAMKGKTKCRIHGGANNGPPKGNKNALKTGQYEAVISSTMTDDEVAYRNGLNTDPLVTLEETLKTLRVRELRILRRIKKAMDAEAIAGTPTGKYNKSGNEILHPSTLTIGGQQTKKDGSESFTVQSESHARYIERLENALTAVQDQIRRVSESIAKLRSDGDDNGDVRLMGVLVSPGLVTEEAWAAAANR